MAALVEEQDWDEGEEELEGGLTGEADQEERAEGDEQDDDGGDPTGLLGLDLFQLHHDFGVLDRASRGLAVGGLGHVGELLVGRGEGREDTSLHVKLADGGMELIADHGDLVGGDGRRALRNGAL